MRSRRQFVFYISVWPVILGFLVFFLIVAILGGRAVLLGKAALTDWEEFLLISGFFLIAALVGFRGSVWTAEFSEKSAKFGGIRFHREVDFSQIEKVTKVTVFPLFRSNTQVHIFLRGESKPIIVPMNPRSLRLKIDLYSWLTHRAIELTP